MILGDSKEGYASILAFYVNVTLWLIGSLKKWNLVLHSQINYRLFDAFKACEENHDDLYYLKGSTAVSKVFHSVLCANFNSKNPISMSVTV
jgi:hypothetical protein